MTSDKVQILYWALCLMQVVFIRSDEQEYRLTRYLMSNYDPAVRPSQNSSQALRVTFELALHQIIDVDERNQILTTNCWLTQKWNDVHLRWNTSDFGGINVIRIPVNQVWKPDIILYNNADSQYKTAVINTNVMIRSSGDVIWLSHGIFKSSCEIDVEYFPFDVQTCAMKFASWTYDGFQVELNKEGGLGDLSSYQKNGEFELDEFTYSVHLQKYSCCEESYPDITYTLVLRRRPMFYVFNLILPCLLINIISLLAFYIPSESGEKITLGISTLLSITVYLMVVRESLPPTQKTPLISLYYAVTMCLVAFATIFSALTLNVHHRGKRGIEVPKLVRKMVLGCLARMVFINCSAKHRDSKHKEPSKGYPQEQLSKDDKIELDHIEHYSFSPRLRHRKEMAASAGGDVMADEFERQFLRVLNKVYETIEKNEMRIAEQERRDAIKSEWQQIALVCDRLLLAVFLLATVTSTFLILFSSPHGP
ncbi:neuronal acetylcholine receptor subunit alpha-10-like [Centruroides vittatus]|uniref:neuronal acetylcholine receptor subunit alpha-10-like n=2 Tax=Centruroides TaxID=6875 RepID=UPI000C6DCA1B|nr:neuronal acetylcholine receptor subunit alpha-10-like isoform X2 [Centruroides sculpturatus]